jgi:SAM-dependent methyltransferase
MTPPHPLTAGFDRAAARYDRGRPDLPAEAVDRLVHQLDIGPGRVVLDLGAGTGKLTRALVPSGARLLAVEPTEGMRARLVRAVPSVEVVGGTAEAIDRPAESVDAIVCAQAFHWFDARRATEEAARVLRPGRGIGLVWNLRDEAVPWVAELTRLIDGWDPGAPRGRATEWRAPFEATGRFGPLQEAEVRFVQRADGPTILDRVLSVSFIAVRSPAEQAEVARSVRALLAAHPEATRDGRVDLPYRTRFYWAFRRPRG